jgi:hypothetical protein
MATIIVDYLHVESVSGPTCYAGEDGFSGLTAYVKSDYVELVTLLRVAAGEGKSVTIRCAKLEIEGSVSALQFAEAQPRELIAIAVDELRYFKQGRPYEKLSTIRFIKQ